MSPSPLWGDILLGWLDGEKNYEILGKNRSLAIDNHQISCYSDKLRVTLLCVSNLFLALSPVTTHSYDLFLD